MPRLKKRDKVIRPPNAELNIDLPISSDEIVSTVKGNAELRTDISQSSDEIVPVIKQPTELRTDISTASDTEKVVVPPSTQPINIDIPIAPDTQTVSTPIQTQSINTQISQSSDELVQVQKQPAVLSTDIAVSDDMPMQRFEMGFTGKWQPKGDPLVIGEKNFSEMENWRYNDFGFESVGGATLVNTTALTGTITGGMHLRANYTSTPDSLIFIQRKNGANARTIEYNITEPPAQGDFEDTIYLTEDTSGGDARFSQLPNNTIGICNGKEDRISHGLERECSAFLKSDVDGTDGVKHMYTDENRDWTDTVTTETTGGVELEASTDSVFLVGSTRRLSGFRIDMSNENSTAATLDVKSWDGSAWSSVSNLSDETNAASQSGMVIWDQGSDVPYLVNEYCLYFYEVNVNNVTGTPILSELNARGWSRDVKNMWDGVLRSPLLFRVVSASVGVDYTLDVLTESSSSTSIVAPVGKQGTDATYWIDVIFAEPVCGFKFVLKAINSADATRMQVGKRVGGTPGNVDKDLTADSFQDAASISMNKSGYVYFTETTSQKETVHGITGYYYKIKWTAVLDTTDASVSVDAFYGVPLSGVIAPGKTSHKFPFMYKNRAMWCNSQGDKEYNRVDYSKVNAPDVYNGTDASGIHNERSLYFGGFEPLTCAVEIFNQYGQVVETVALFFKNTETYMLSGDTPSDFKIFTISKSIGCPAPKTITSAEISFKAQDAPAQNIALWLSDKGPVMFLGNTIRRIPGVENFFDTNVDSTSNLDVQNIAQASAWFGATYQEWNLLFPVGTAGSQTTNNKWIVYDIVRDKWFEKKPDSSAMFPQGAFPVEDQYGNVYNYSYGVDGFLQREESGLNWQVAPGASTTYAVSQVVTTSDFFFTKSIWDETRIRRFETIWAEVNQTALDVGGTLNASYYYQASITTTAVTGLPSDHAMGYAGYRVRHLISYIDKIAWCHRFKLTVTNAIGKLALLGIGIQWQRVREGLRDKEYFNSDP